VRRYRTLHSLAYALVALALMLAACSSDDEETTTSPATSDGAEAPNGGATPPSALGSLPPEFIKCMADQGVDIEGPGEFHSPEAQRAFPACLQFLHQGGAP
jgi:hypothetical protein